MASVMEFIYAKRMYAQSLLSQERYASGGMGLEEHSRPKYLIWKVRSVYFFLVYTKNSTEEDNLIIVLLRRLTWDNVSMDRNCLIM